MTDRELMQQALEALSAMLTHMGMDEDEWNRPTFNQCRKAEAALRERLAQPEQKPVASVHIKDGCLVGSHRKDGEPFPDGEYGLWSLYTNPPRREWQGLTDEEIVRICTESWRTTPSDIFYARAIEAKLREKNA